MTFQEAEALDAFGALSQETRLRMLRILVRAGEAGLAAGAVSEAVGTSAPNASFHLAHLERAGLVRSRREARSVIYQANFRAIAALGEFLLKDCCKG